MLAPVDHARFNFAIIGYIGPVDCPVLSCWLLVILAPNSISRQLGISLYYKNGIVLVGGHTRVRWHHALSMLVIMAFKATSRSDGTVERSNTLGVLEFVLDEQLWISNVPRCAVVVGPKNVGFHGT